MNNAEKVKREVVNALMSNIDFLIKKDQSEYKEPNVQNPEKIEKEDKKMKMDYFNMASKFYEMDLKVTRENNQKKLYDVLKKATNIKPNNVKIDEKPDLEDLFIA